VGAHLDRWGYPKEIIAENDWNETVMLGDGFATTLVPARHFSGRGLKRKNTLWTSYVLNTPTSKIFLGGDSGYDFHFKKIGDEHGPFDLAILENGQYDKSWKYIHLMPEEVIQAALDLQAKQLLPVHFAKFAIANHAWDDPLKRVTEAGQHAPLKLLTPMIGEAVDFKNPPQEFAKWWEGIN
jgi:L-ascorbate metabolism protein UlaG (beta-lactamase superfamily)